MSVGMGVLQCFSISNAILLGPCSFLLLAHIHMGRGAHRKSDLVILLRYEASVVKVGIKQIVNFEHNAAVLN